MLKILSFIFTLFALLSQVQAALPAVDISYPNYQIGKFTEFYEDTENTLDFSKITTVPQNIFSPLKNDVSTHLFTQSTLYYKFNVMNPKESLEKRVIVFETPWLDSIEVLVVSPYQQHSRYTAGNLYPFKQRAIHHHNPNIQHEFETGLSTVYVQVKTRDPFIVPISILESETLIQDQFHDVTLSMFIYGFLLAMILYHFILYINIKLPYYAFYVLYLTSFLIMNATYNGYSYQWLFPDMPTLQNWLQSTHIFLFAIFGLLFARSFLNLEKYIPFAYKSLNILIISFIATLIISSLFGYHYHVMLSIAMSIVFSGFVFSVALLSLLKGNTYARFFLLGTTAGLIGTSITALTVMALIPYSDLGYQAVDFGMLVDSILLSFALVDRLKSNEKEKERAEQLAKIDALTGLQNRRAFNELCQLQTEHKSHINSPQTFALLIDLDNFKQVNKTYGHATGDLVLQRVARLLRHSLKSRDHLFRFAGEEFLILLESSDVQNIKQRAEQIQSAIANMSVDFSNHSIRVTASIGISEFTVDKSSLDEVELKAVEAIFQANQLGSNQIVIVD
ncbi:MAG: diguanylate cyclase [Pseudomonadota bacterium]|nr:diguanylate cyclase [Pseudomonadota bacterium]